MLERFLHFSSLTQLQSDFIGVQFNIFGVVNFLLLILCSLLLFLYFYLLGQKIRLRFFSLSNSWSEKYFISIALGYILICSGLTLLGFASLLSPYAIFSYLFLLTIIIILPFSSLTQELQNLSSLFSGWKSWFKSNRLLKVLIISFVLLAILRLMLPETEADAMGYHTIFPRLYLFYQTMRLSPAMNIEPIAIPQLGEMPYVLATFFHIVKATQFIHFIFFILCTLLLLSQTFFKKGTRYSLYLTLLFVSSPVILQYAPASYSDFQHLFLFILMVMLMVTKKDLSKRSLILLGLLYGGTLATKFFALLYLPSIVLYFIYDWNRKSGFELKKSVLRLTAFLFAAFLIPLPWYVQLISLQGQVPKSFGYSLLTVTPGVDIHSGFNLLNKLNPSILKEFSPLLILAVIGILVSFKKFRQELGSSSVTIFILLFLFFALFFPQNMTSGRYFIPTFFLLSIALAQSLVLLTKKFHVGNYLVCGIASLILLRFLGTTLLLLPYGLGWADAHQLITRQLTINTSSYFDVDHKFSPFIKPQEEVMTYNVEQFYYADFIPLNIFMFLRPGSPSLTFPKKNSISKLYIRGGDIVWLCVRMKINTCNHDHFVLLNSDTGTKQYLYQITK